MGKRSHPQSIAKGRKDINPQKKELFNHQPVSPDQPAECGRKDLLWCCGSKILSFTDTAMQKNRDSGLLRIFETCKHHLASDPNCQGGKISMWCSWILQTPLGQCLMRPCVLCSTSSRYQRASQGVRPRPSVLCNTGQHQCMAAP